MSLIRSFVPGTPGRPNSAVIFSVGAEANCSGDELGEMPTTVNLSVYRVGAEQDGLVLARLDAGEWDAIPEAVAKDGVISATIQRTGTFVVYERS